MTFLEVGRVLGPQGVRGAVRVSAHSGDPSGMLRARRLMLSGAGGGEPGSVREVSVIAAHRARGCAVFSLEGIVSLEAAQSLTGAGVSVRREDLPPLSEDEFYWADAVGCTLVDGEGNALGEVTAVLPGPAHDWLVVRRGGEEAYLPVVAAFLRSVDVPGRRIVASPPEGW